MADESNPDRIMDGHSTPGERPDTMPGPAASSPVYETEQPDTALRTGGMGIVSTALASVAAAVILGVVLYGLNSTPPAGQAAAPAHTASSAPTAASDAAKPPPQAGENGHS